MLKILGFLPFFIFISYKSKFKSVTEVLWRYFFREYALRGGYRGIFYAIPLKIPVVLILMNEFIFLDQSLLHSFRQLGRIAIY